MGTDEVDVIVVGAGQAGLATSHEFTALGIDHVVLERGEGPGTSWASRWESFCLVTPNHAIALPGGEYRGDEPQGYLSRAAIVEHLAAYAASFAAPLHTGVEVVSLLPAADGRLRLTAADGSSYLARAVVVASGGLRGSFRPPWAAEIDAVPVLAASQYRNPASLPDGAVLIVGSGQTGCQLAEELAPGRRVILACGRAPWMPRRIDGRDTFDYLLETRFMEQTLADVPLGPATRFLANPQATGRDGGHDLTTRTLQAQGVELAGHVAGLDDGTIGFAGDLAQMVAFGDARWAELSASIRAARLASGREVPELPEPAPFDAGAELHRLPVKEISSILLTTGFRPSYRAWIDIPDAFDPMGFPLQNDGRSSVVPGLWFVGVPFMRTRSSQLLFGVGRDAGLVAEGVRSELRN